MTRTLFLMIGALASTLLMAPCASAQSDDALGDEEAITTQRDELDEHRRDPVLEHVRFEGTMGFVAGAARYSEVGLAGDPSVPRMFDAGPAAAVAMTGLRYDLRLVVAFVRMTVGADVLFGLFDASSGGRVVESGDAALRVVDRRFFEWSLRFGLGLEATVGDVRLFADALVVAHFVEAEVAIDGRPTGYAAVAASPGLRLGVRIPIVGAFFAQLEIDGAAFAPTWGGGALSVGGAFQ
jgi:hypothetical protein